MKKLSLTLALGLAAVAAEAAYTNVVNPVPAQGLGWITYTNPCQGFNLYWGTNSRTYQNRIFIPGQGTTSATLSNLLLNTTYFAALTATNAGLESDFSNEVTWTTPAVPVSPSGFKLTSATLILQFGP